MIHGYLVAILSTVVTLAPAQPDAGAPQSARVFTEKQLDHFSKLVESTKPDRLTRLKTDVRLVFDFSRFAELSMGKRWSKLSKKQKTRFSRAVRALLEKSYLKHPDKIFAKHRVQIMESDDGEERATVTGLIRQDDVDVDVVLKLYRNGEGDWRAYDVVFDELSLLEDYKYQFISYLNKKTVDQLITRLDSKTKS